MGFVVRKTVWWINVKHRGRCRRTYGENIFQSGLEEVSQLFLSYKLKDGGLVMVDTRVVVKFHRRSGGQRLI